MKRHVYVLITLILCPLAQADEETECSQIRLEIARVRALAENPPTFPQRPMSGPFQPMDMTPLLQQRFKMRAAERIAALESRASTIGCYSAFSDKPAPSNDRSERGMNFDECFNKCKQHTKRTDEQCFDTCKR